MTINTQPIKQTSFYLYSSRNHRLYPPNKYPLTHLLDYQKQANTTSARRIQQRRITRSQIGHGNRLAQLIREEGNIQRLKLEREQSEELHQRLYGVSINRPASASFIAKFRSEYKDNENIDDITLNLKNKTCGISQEDFIVKYKYAKWPCPSRIPHIFHYDCMLKSLRKKNTSLVELFYSSA